MKRFKDKNLVFRRFQNKNNIKCIPQYRGRLFRNGGILYEKNSKTVFRAVECFKRNT